jgi:hypothetical protein
MRREFVANDPRIAQRIGGRGINNVHQNARA